MGRTTKIIISFDKVTKLLKASNRFQKSIKVHKINDQSIRERSGSITGKDTMVRGNTKVSLATDL